MLIRNVDVDGSLVDVRVEGSIIKQIAPNIDGRADIDGNGGALLPGLHDHHIHLNATAAAMNSVPCGPPQVMNGDGLIAALNNAKTPRIRGVGYHQSVAGDIDRAWLDTHGPDKPVRIQHRSGRLWILNSLAMDELERKEPRDGRILDDDTSVRFRDFPDLSRLVDKLFSYGMTGATEVTPSNTAAEFNHYLENAGGLNLSIMGSDALSEIKHPRRGHRKLHYHENNLPGLDELSAQIEAAHVKGRPVAAHCVTRSELMLTLAAIEQAGVMPGDRIEHAAIADEAAVEWMKSLDVIVVTQPNFICERGAQYAQDVPKRDHQYLWPLKSFLDAGIKTAAGSDAPFGDPDPWAAMHAAVNRPAGFGQDEAVTPEQALALYTKPAENAGGAPRAISVGQPADLCVIDRTWREARKNLAAVKVNATIVGGVVRFSS